jgi:hypothetical protein
MRGFLNKKLEKSPQKEIKKPENTIWAGSSDDESTRTKAKLVSIRFLHACMTDVYPLKHCLAFLRVSSANISRLPSISGGIRPRETSRQRVGISLR